MRFPHFYCARRDGNPTQWQSTGQASAPSRKRLQAEKRRPPALFPHHQAVVLAERCGKAGFNPRSQRGVKVEMAENRPSGLKPVFYCQPFTARLKPCPFKSRLSRRPDKHLCGTVAPCQKATSGRIPALRTRPAPRLATKIDRCENAG